MATGRSDQTLQQESQTGSADEQNNFQRSCFYSLPITLATQNIFFMSMHRIQTVQGSTVSTIIWT